MSRPLRVLSLSTLYPSAARPRFGLFVARQFDALAASGEAIELEVINPVPRALGLLRLIARHNPDLCHLPADRTPAYPVHYQPFSTVPRMGAWWNPALLARAVLPLAQRLHAARPFDLVDAQFFFPDGPAAARIAAALGLPLTIKARGSDIHYWGTLPRARSQILKAARQSAAMLAVSAGMRTDMAALGMDADRIAVHYTGLDQQLFAPRPRHEARARLRQRMGLSSEGPLLASVGNLIPLKGHDLVIRALADLPQARLIIAGSGPEDARLRTLAEQLGLDNRVTLAGSLPPDELADLYCAASAMILPSEREGLANAWIEALACGTPLIVTDVGGAREIVRDDTAGRIVERTPQAITAAVSDLLAADLSQNAVAAQVSQFSWQANARQLAATYRKAALA